MIIGICGGSGSGKTTIARKVVESVGKENVNVIEHDAYYYHLGNLPFEERRKVNFDHPDSIDNDLFVSHIKLLKSGHVVEMPIYDFKTYTRSDDTERLDPKPVLIVEGILIFTEPRILDLLDVRIFVDTPGDIRFIRRLQRDVVERGYTFESVIARYYANVRPMHFQFVEPSKRNADLIIPESGKQDIGIEFLCSKIREELKKNNNNSDLGF